MTKRQPLVIYHAHCNDGYTAAWVAYKALGGAELLAAYHNSDPPDVKWREVYILDFAYSRDVLLQLNDDAASLTLLDHHITAEEDLKDLPFCVFDIKHSGARLAWNYFNPEDANSPPALVEYVEDRDLWRWKLEFSEEINAALYSYEHSIDTWDNLYSRLNTTDGFNSLFEEGATLLRVQANQVKQAIRRAVPIEILGHTVLATNSTIHFSEIAGELAKRKPFGIAWFRRHDGRFVYSLRSTQRGEDVSAIAKHFGGGGHKRSAGFVSDLLPENLVDA